MNLRTVDRVVLVYNETRRAARPPSSLLATPCSYLVTVMVPCIFIAMCGVQVIL